MSHAGGSLERLAAMMRGEGGLISTLLAQDAEARALAARKADGARGPAQIAASGPRASANPAEYELLIEAIYEGYLLHYSTPRLVATAEADLALLAGDQLYALGLARLVKLGDVAAVAELADVIALCALAHGCGRRDLAELVWEAGARAIGWGASAAHGSPQALAAMRAAAQAPA